MTTFSSIYTGVDDLPNVILEDERGYRNPLESAKDGQCCGKKCECDGVCPEIDSTNKNDYLYCFKCQCQLVVVEERAKCSATCLPIVTLHGGRPLIDDNAPL